MKQVTPDDLADRVAAVIDALSKGHLVEITQPFESIVWGQLDEHVVCAAADPNRTVKIIYRGDKDTTYTLREAEETE